MTDKDRESNSSDMNSLIHFQASPPRSENQKVHIVFSALENPKYRWRTINGLAKETGVDEATVKRVLNRINDAIVKSSIPSTSGDDLYTTRRHLKKMENVFSRFVAVLRNRAS